MSLRDRAVLMHFRGLPKDSNDFVFGDLIQESHTTSIRHSVDHVKKHTIVRPETVGQLLQSGKSKLFEDDVILWGKKIFLIVWDDESFAFNMRALYKIPGAPGLQFNFSSHCLGEYKLIGNIHQQPDLLETGKNYEEHLDG